MKWATTHIRSTLCCHIICPLASSTALAESGTALTEPLTYLGLIKQPPVDFLNKILLSNFLKRAFDKHTVKLFTVVNHLDLNRLSQLRQPCLIEGEKILCCGPCKSMPINATFSILKGSTLLTNI